MNRSHRSNKPLVAVALPMMLAAVLASPSTANDDIWARSRAMYASLDSYADSGVVLSEFGVSSRERHTFTTSFSRAPRGFHFDFQKGNGDRFVIWGDPQAFHTWWKTTNVKSDYPNPNNIAA